MTKPRVPFNRPYATGKELGYIQAVIESGHLSGDGEFTRRCHRFLVESLGAKKALLTHSCTGALEMAAILAGVEPGDEVILPSYTFVSTANAFVLRGAVPVFVDIRPDTLNLDERAIEAAITPKTKAICVVHYAGVACEMDPILALAQDRRLVVVEDAAQGAWAFYRNRALGTIAPLAALSFHETKNLVSGEGGALLVNEPALAARAEIVREKGTNRSAFFRGEVDKYTWVDVGSSYLPSEIIAAFLWAQLEDAQALTERRLALWKQYDVELADAERAELLRRPIVPAHCAHNGHMYYVLAPSLEARTRVITALRERGFHSVFHYVPLHSSPAGRRHGRAVGTMAVTDSVSDRLLRLPLWVGMSPADVSEIAAIVTRTLRA